MTPVDLTFHSVLAEAIASYITAKRAGLFRLQCG
jgi:hypothetical protein